MANVKLQGTRTIPETVSVPETVVVEETIRILSERFELVDRWIRDGQGWKTKSTITARSRKKTIRRATEKDIHAYFVIEYLRKFVRELDD
jgi:hypothetical protein